MIKPIVDFKIYRACPEIRKYIRRIYALKLLYLMTLVPLLPLIIVGAGLRIVVHVLDLIIPVVIFVPRYVADLAYTWHQNLIETIHNRLDPAEIRSRIEPEFSTNDEEE